MKRDILMMVICLTLLMLPALWGGERDNIGAYSPSCKEDWILILDPGHGGEDGGASTAGGDRESDINLAITLRLEQVLALCGQPTLLTRNQDVSIHSPDAATIREKKVSDLKNRAELVEHVGYGLLLSVHQNSFTDPRYSGAQVFYNHVEGSQLWAEQTQEMLRLSLDQGNKRSAKPVADNIYLMNSVSCPAILVECGFLSNGAESSLLLTSSYQTKIATTLAGACLQYIQMLS